MAKVRCASAALLLAALTGMGARAEGRRFLLDEVVAVVAAHSITLSEVRAEARIALVEERGPLAVALEPDRGLLAATLQRMIDQRLVLTEIESLRILELDRTEVEAALLRFRPRVGAPERYEAFLRNIQLTDDEVGQVLARQIRYARYIDSRAKLSGAPRQGETEEACRKELGREPTAPELEACSRKLQLERYRKVTQDVLAELRRRLDVRVLDPIGER